MFGLILLLLIVVPIVELYVLFQVADSFGWLTSIIVLFSVSLLGGSLMRWQTAGALRRISAKMSQGEMPSKELVDGALMIFGGALLLTPGFFTDAVGLAMFIPPTRAVARRAVINRMRGRLTPMTTSIGTSFGFGFGHTSRGPDSFIDVDEVPYDHRDVKPVNVERTDEPSIELPPTSAPGSETS